MDTAAGFTAPQIAFAIVAGNGKQSLNNNALLFPTAKQNGGLGLICLDSACIRLIKPNENKQKRALRLNRVVS